MNRNTGSEHERSVLTASLSGRINTQSYLVNAEDLPYAFQSLSDSGHILDVNTQWCEMLGYSKEEVIGSHITEFHPEETRPLFDENFAEFKASGRVCDFHMKFFTKWGELKIMNVNGRLVQDAGKKKKRTLCLLRDVTNEIRYKIELLDKAKYLAVLAELSYHLSTIKDEEIDYKRITDLVGPVSYSGRTYIFLSREKDSKILCSQLAEWCAEGVKPEINNPELQDFDFGKFSNIVLDKLVKGDIINTRVSKLNSPFREFLLVQNIKSLLVAPLNLGGEFYGFIGCDNCNDGKIWNPASVDFLKTVAGELVQAIKRLKDWKKLKESEKRYRDVLEKIQLIGIMLDTDGNIIFCNDFLLQTTGRTREETENSNWFDLFIDESIRDNLKGNIFKKAIESGDFPLLYTNEIVTQNGSKSLIEWYNIILRGLDNKINGITSIGKDITDRVRYEMALKKSEARLQSIFKTAPIGICFLKERVLQYTNRAFREMTGYSSEELVGEDVLFLYPGTDEYKQVGDTNISLLNKFGVGQVETQFKTKIGKIIDVAISSSLVEEGNPGTGITATIVDITERKRYIREIEKLNKELEDRVFERTEQLENALEELKEAKETLEFALKKEKELGMLKTRFISMISHEYRTPLTVILSSSHIIDFLAKNNEYEEIKKHLDKIHHSVSLMTNLLEDVITIGTSEEKALKPAYSDVEVNALLMEIVEEFMQIEQNYHIFKFSGTVDNNPIISDPSMLRQIVRNLISNAVKYSPEGSEVTIETEVKNDSIKIAISDQGFGIADEDRKHIFEPFFRHKDYIGKIQGTGLGLSIVKQCTDALGGTIELNSSSGGGSRFVARIPTNNKS